MVGRFLNPGSAPVATVADWWRAPSAGVLTSMTSGDSGPAASRPHRLPRRFQGRRRAPR